jgi:hypothetical protein
MYQKTQQDDVTHPESNVQSSTSSSLELQWLLKGWKIILKWIRKKRKAQVVDGALMTQVSFIMHCANIENTKAISANRNFSSAFTNKGNKLDSEITIHCGEEFR